MQYVSDVKECSYSYSYIFILHMLYFLLNWKQNLQRTLHMMHFQVLLIKVHFAFEKSKVIIKK